MNLVECLNPCERHQAAKHSRQQHCEAELEKETTATSIITGTVVNTQTRRAEPGVKVTYVDSVGKLKTSHTDDNGQYKLVVPLCSYWTYFIEKEGFSKPTVEGRCKEPVFFNMKKVLVSHGIGPILPDGQIRVVLTWLANDKNLKDLDLHLLVPGQRDVKLKSYKEWDGTKPAIAVDHRDDFMDAASETASTKKDFHAWIYKSFAGASAD